MSKIFGPKRTDDGYWRIETDQEINDIFFYIFFSVALRPNAGEGLLIREVSRSHTQRRVTVGRTSLDE